MKKILVTCLLFITITCFSVETKNKKLIIGKWKIGNSNRYMVFSENDQFKLLDKETTIFKGKFIIRKDILFLLFKNNRSRHFKINQIDQNKLVLFSQHEVVYTRVP